MEGDSLTFLRLKNTEETEELTTQVGVRDQDLQVDQVNDKQIMGVSVNSKPPFNVAEIIRKYCPKAALGAKRTHQRGGHNSLPETVQTIRLQLFKGWITLSSG